jgi:ABC-type multidrug transport system fused ATPase/permease subunit
MSSNLIVQDSGTEVKLEEQIRRYFTGGIHEKYRFRVISHILGSFLKFPIVLFLTILAFLYEIQGSIFIFVNLLLISAIIAILFMIHSGYSSYKLNIMLYKLQCPFLEKVESENLVSSINRDKHDPKISFTNPDDSHPLQLFIKMVLQRKNRLSKIENWPARVFMIDLVLLPVLIIGGGIFQALWDGGALTELIFVYLVIFCFLTLLISAYVTNILFNLEKVYLAILGANIKEWAYSFHSKRW